MEVPAHRPGERARSGQGCLPKQAPSGHLEDTYHLYVSWLRNLGKERFERGHKLIGDFRLGPMADALE